MLKTQITGAKYLSPQTNQMTNLNIAIPADSKDTEFGTSDILLAKDVVTYLNALDSDISNELATQTDKINKINESIKQLIDHNLIKIVTELPTTDIDKNCIYLVPNKDGEGNNVFIEYIYVESKNTFEEVGRIQAKVDLSDYYTKEETDNQIQIAKNSAINIHNEDNTKSIKLDINDTEANDGYGSAVNVSLTNDAYQVNINALDGFRHSDGAGGVSNFYSNGLYIGDGINRFYIHANQMTINNEIGDFVSIGTRDGKHSQISLGTDHKFKISYPENGTEGATITGVKSLTAFSNPSATKVWATDGSTVDLTTKANTSDLATKANASDVLLKKNSRDGYYIGDSNDSVGSYAFSIGGNTADGSNSFASGYDTKAYGSYSHVEGYYTEARGESAHAEGDSTYADGNGSHSEGNYTHAIGSYSHAEGHNTYANCYAAHAQGAYNIIAKNVIHSVGIGNNTTRKNAEYIYAKSNTNNTQLVDDPKNGYKYLIGVGGYDGISTDNSTYKSVQEVIADLTARIEQLETKVRALEAANTPA